MTGDPTRGRLVEISEREAEQLVLLRDTYLPEGFAYRVLDGILTRYDSASEVGDEARVQTEAERIRERTIEAALQREIGDWMSDEECCDVEASVRADFADEPLPEPMDRRSLGFAARHAAGYQLAPYDWRREESYQLTVALDRKEPASHE